MLTTRHYSVTTFTVRKKIDPPGTQHRGRRGHPIDRKSASEASIRYVQPSIDLQSPPLGSIWTPRRSIERILDVHIIDLIARNVLNGRRIFFLRGGAVTDLAVGARRPLAFLPPGARQAKTWGFRVFGRDICHV